MGIGVLLLMLLNHFSVDKAWEKERENIIFADIKSLVIKQSRHVSLTYFQVY